MVEALYSPENQADIRKTLKELAGQKGADPLAAVLFAEQALNNGSVQQYLEIFARSMGEQLTPIFEQAIESMRPIARQQIAVLCLTEEPDNQAMWAHYAKNGTGFVIEFDALQPWFFYQNDQSKSRLRKVFYGERDPQNIDDLDDYDLMCTKAIHWSYEKEWRVLEITKNATHVTADNFHLFDFPKDAVSRIILGPNMNRDDELSVVTEVAINYWPLSVCKAVDHKRKYEIFALS